MDLTFGIIAGAVDHFGVSGCCQETLFSKDVLRVFCFLAVDEKRKKGPRLGKMSHRCGKK